MKVEARIVPGYHGIHRRCLEDGVFQPKGMSNFMCNGLEIVLSLVFPRGPLFFVVKVNVTLYVKGGMQRMKI